MKANTGGLGGHMNIMEKEIQSADMDCQPGSSVASPYESYWRIKG
jgi:hypothetical protein